MIRIVAFSLLTLALTLSASADAVAQRMQNAHGFQQTYPGALAIGLSAGANINLGTGGPSNTCNCELESGSGVGYHAGLHLDIMVNRFIGLRLQGLYEDHSSVYEADRSIKSYSQDGAPVDITARRRDEVAVRYMSTAFLLTWYSGPEGLYVMAGASAGFYLDGNVRDEEYILTPGYSYANTGNNRLIFSDGPLDAAAETQLRGGLVFGAGYDIPLGRGLAIAPEAQIDYPLTSVVKGNDDWSIPTVRASVVFRFGL